MKKPSLLRILSFLPNGLYGVEPKARNGCSSTVRLQKVVSWLSPSTCRLFFCFQSSSHAVHMNVTSDKLWKGQVLGTCWCRPVSAGAESNSEYRMGNIDHRHNPSFPSRLENSYPDALANKFPPFCGIRRFIFVFATQSHWSLSAMLYPPSGLNVVEMGRIMCLFRSDTL